MIPAKPADHQAAERAGQHVRQVVRDVDHAEVLAAILRVGQHLGDQRLVDGRVAFFGPVNDLDAAPEPVIHDFIQLDEVSFLK